MKIKQVDFVGSYPNINGAPTDKLPEVAFAGRSNVGKSSLINRMLQRKSIARTSSTPGKTRLLNYIRINNEIYFVDLPGYGFAKVPRSEKESWKRLIENYILNRETLSCVVSIIDSRHGPMDSDLELIEWLTKSEVPCLVVATKIDKLNRKQFNESEKRILKAIEQFPVHGPVFVSSASGQGRNELWQSINQLLE